MIIEAHQRWQKVSARTLTVLAGVFLTAFAIPILLWPHVDPVIDQVCALILTAAWALFALDFATGLWAAKRRGEPLGGHMFGIVFVLFPVLQPFRWIRLATVLTAINRRGSSNLRARVIGYALAGAAMIAFIGGLIVVDNERADPTANIITVGDAMWWAVVTIATVGYGDRYPVTPVGRLVAVVLMTFGIALLGAATATMSSILIDRVQAAGAQDDQMREELMLLRSDVNDLHGRLGDSDGSADQAEPVGPSGDPAAPSGDEGQFPRQSG